MRTAAKVLLTVVCAAGILFAMMSLGMALLMLLVGSYGAALAAAVAGTAVMGMCVVYGPRW